LGNANDVEEVERMEVLENGVVGQPAVSSNYIKQIISKGWTDCQFVV
jgi:hypothetical protein